MMLHPASAPSPFHHLPVNDPAMGMMMREPAPQQQHHAPASSSSSASAITRRKRKAESQDNEQRLSKRLGRLNLEQQGAKLYVPVETPAAAPYQSSPRTSPPRGAPASSSYPGDSAPMQVDDTKHKVYIYNLDDELSSSESEAEDGNGRLVFLPDIEKHLFANRIPPAVLANSDGELAGMQMVVYGVPSSLTVPESADSVRRAIIEARARVREKQRAEQGEVQKGQAASSGHDVQGGMQGEAYDPDAMDVD